MEPPQGGQAVAARGRDVDFYGVIHLPPLPGTPFHRGAPMGDYLAAVANQSAALQAGGAAGVLLQTSDRVHPAGDEADPARVAAMTLITRAAVDATSGDFRVGVQIMRNATSASLAVAKLAGAHFIRVSALIGVTSSTQGWVVSDARSLMELRTSLDAWDVDVHADIATVHYSWYGSPVEIEQLAHRAIVVGANAVCIGVPDTETTRQDLARMRQLAPEIRVLLSGHCTEENAHILLPLVDGAFVSRLLTGGEWLGTFEADDVRLVLNRLRHTGA